MDQAEALAVGKNPSVGVFARRCALLLLALGCQGTTTPAGLTWATLGTRGSYTCGISLARQVYCWGGVPGYFTPIPDLDSVVPNSTLPREVAGASDAAKLAVAGLSMCILNAEGAAFCWGANQTGEVGDGSRVARLHPTAVIGNMRWRSISAGDFHVCGITLEGQAYCWGNGFRGALGNGSVDPLVFPALVPVAGGYDFAAVFGGAAATCGLLNDGEAFCWGANDFGELGDGLPPEGRRNSPSPQPVVGSHRFSTLSLGSSHTCGITIDQRAFCWGWNAYGQVGDGTTAHTSSPVEVEGGRHWTSLVTGGYHTCGRTTDGVTYCWGRNDHGQLGTGSTSNSASPQPVAGGEDFVVFTLGEAHSCALTSTGHAWCWGRGDYGQLGTGALIDQSTPRPVTAP
jgi:alpha-tubulin suppressor-like RCC1 family protein